MTSMYRLKRQVEVPNVVELPSCMYKMEIVNRMSRLDLASSYYGTARAASTPQKSEDVTALEVRQEALLERLQHLRQQLDHLLGNKVVTSAPHTSSYPVTGASVNSSPVKTESVHDLVISANPDSPPFSLVLLRKLLGEAGFPVYSVNHLHSSVLQVNDSLRGCFTDNPSGDRNKHKVAFTLHWKDVLVPSLMVNPLRQTQISGEANIIRYISRLFPLTSQYNYEASGTFMIITETDQLMDQMTKQIANGNNKERQAALRQLNGRLGKNMWLMGNTCSIVDVLTWSLVRQAHFSVIATANVNKWYKSMNTLAGLDTESASKESQRSVETETPCSRQSNCVESPKTTQNSKKIKESKERTKDKQKIYLDRTGLEMHLKQLNIPYQIHDHEEVFTVDALMQNVKDMPGLHMKNLFLKDKKKALYLLSARHNAEVKLNEVGKQIGVKDLRFGDEAVLFDALGVKQGCVTAYALLNDTKHQVKFLLDQEALSDSHPFVNFHPMSNSATLGIAPKDFSKFLTSTGHEPTILTFN